MKNLKSFLILIILISGFSSISNAQIVLPEVKIEAINYKYLNSVGDAVALPVKRLQREVAAFDLKTSDFYEDEYDTYFISFYIPEGEILAAYDKDGKLLRTAEKYKNVKLPIPVAATVAQKYPGWGIAKDVYLVSYYESKGINKVYKLILENGNKRMRIKTNESGDII
ncbi:hypothetical protein [Daejeonella sp.]|jgi:hypothetical protein|uniref:hypothetical protein n=1 Tax=Daejeonella sp. TaxID=2805397 RepID=UPI0037848D82